MRKAKILLAVVATLSLSGCGQMVSQSYQDPQSKVKFTLTGKEIAINAQQTAFAGQQVALQCFTAISYQDMQEKIKGKLLTINVALPAQGQATFKAPGEKTKNVCLISADDNLAIAIFSAGIAKEYAQQYQEQQQQLQAQQATKTLRRYFAYAQAEAVTHGAFVSGTFTVEDLAQALSQRSGSEVSVVTDSSQLQPGEVAISTQTTADNVVFLTRQENGVIWQGTGQDDLTIDRLDSQPAATTP